MANWTNQGNKMHDYLRFLVQGGILIQPLLISKYPTFKIFLKIENSKWNEIKIIRLLVTMNYLDVYLATNEI